jgi:Domain of unknown function (DUF4290)
MKRAKLEPHGMDYNSDKESLLYPEYGRNIQAMIDYAKSESHMEKRQMMVESIVNLMYQMNPQSKNVDDYKEKLWKHVFHIAEYNLGGVLPPSGIHPAPEDAVKRPERISYPASGARYRHYGNNVHQLIKKALSMDDEVKRAGMINTIGAYMKLAYRTWNKEHYVSDDIIKGDLEALSNGQLQLDEDVAIDRLAAANKRRTASERNTGSNNNRSNDNRGGTNNYRSNDSRGGTNNYRSNDSRTSSGSNDRNSNNRSNDNRSNDRNNNRNSSNNNNNPNNNRRK